MAKLPKHMRRSGPPPVDPVNKTSAMGMSHRDPQNTEKELTSIEVILYQFKALENSVLTLNKTKESHPRFLVPVEVYEIAKSIKRQNKKSNLTESQINQLIKKEVRRKNEVKARKIADLTSKSIPDECNASLSAIIKELNSKDKNEIIRNICKEHITKIEKTNVENFEISAYIKKLSEIALSD